MLQNATKKKQRIATLVAFASIPLSGFMTDIYLPSFPAMSKNLMVAEKEIQFTLTAFLLSYGISQLFIGSLLDSIGRYKPKLISLIVLFFTSFFISKSTSIEMITTLRVVQGLAISLMVVANRAFFVDLYNGEKLKNYLSYFTIVWSTGPIVAPFLGGYLEKHFHWQANFYFLAFYAAVLFIFDVIYGGETLQKAKKFNLKEVRLLYINMLRNPMFILGIITLGLAFSVVMVFSISGPFLIENIFHKDAVTIGYATLILGFSWMIGGIISKKMVRYKLQKRIAWPAALQFGLLLLLFFVSFYIENLFILVAFAFLVHICSGFLYTLFFTTSMLYFPQNAGIAGGLLGGLVYVITSFTTYIIAQTGPVETVLQLSTRYLIMSLLLLVVVATTLWNYNRSLEINQVE